MIQWPSLVVNERTIGWFAPEAMKWKSIDVKIKSRGFLSKSFRLAFDGLCYQEKGKIDACFDRVRVAFVLGLELEGLSPRLHELGPIEIMGGTVWAKFGQDGEKTEKNSDGPLVPNWVRSAIENTKLHPVRIQVMRWEVEQEDSLYAGAFDLRTQGKRVGERFEAYLNADQAVFMKDVKKIQLAVDLKFSNSGKSLDDPWLVTGTLGGDLEKGERIDAKLAFQQLKDLTFDFKVDGGFKGNGKGKGGLMAVESQFAGRVSPDSFDATIDATARNVAEQVRKVTVNECRVSLDRLERREKARTSSDRGNLKVDCPVVIGLPDLNGRAIGKGIKGIEFPAEMEAKLAADLETSFPPSASEWVEGAVEVTFDPSVGSKLGETLLESDGRVNAELAGIPSEYPKGWKLDGGLKFAAALPEFGALVRVLDDSPWAVPAPVRVLKGRVEVAADGKLGLKDGSVKIPLRTRLASKHQRLVLDGDAAVTYSEGGKLDVVANLLLKDVKLSLPRLDQGEVPPSVVPDNRILYKEPEEEKAESKLQYAGRVATGEEPVRIFSNLAETPIPIGLDIRMKSGGAPEGEIRVMDFPVMIFKKEALIHHLSVDLDGNNNLSEIDGLVVVKFPDYTVKVVIMGTLEKTRIKLQSDPPLPEDQIIAALIFNRPIEELDNEQSTSVGSAQSALASGALGLASLYYLASTPVESIGYDPLSGLVTAKLKIAAGTSVDLGVSGQEAVERIGFTRRLGANWRLRTEVGNLGASDDARSVTAFLEWHRRY